MTPEPGHRWLGWASLAALLLGWQALALWRESRFLPSPLTVAEHLIWLVREGHLVEDFAVTLARAAVGFVIAMLLRSSQGLHWGVRGWRMGCS